MIKCRPLVISQDLLQACGITCALVRQSEVIALLESRHGESIKQQTVAQVRRKMDE